MIGIFPHSTFEELVSCLHLRRQDSPPKPLTVVIPYLAFGDELCRRLADRFGVFMGWKLLTPREFVHLVVGQKSDNPWAKPHLVWQILPHLKIFTEKFAPLPESPREHFALANLLADSLEQYGHFRPQMLRRWAQDKWAEKSPLDGEDWQRKLWKTVDANIRTAHPGIEHPALELEKRRNDKKFLAGLKHRFPEVLVLGSGSLTPLLVEIIKLLDTAKVPVTVRVLLPTMQFLADLQRKNLLPPVDTDHEIPQDLSDQSHPLLAAMGLQSIGTFQLLGELDEHYTHWPEPCGPPQNQTPPAALLARIQNDIRLLQKPTAWKSQVSDTPCPTLRIHACHGPRREVEVLRDEILRAFAEIPGLKPDEIHIVTPDPATYAPLVSAILNQGTPRLPVRLGERPGGPDDPAVEATLALLEFVSTGRFCASGVLRLVRLPAVLNYFGAEDDTLLSRWIRESGLTHGNGRNTPGAAGFARHRLVAGKWLADDLNYPNGEPVLPVADEWECDVALRCRLTDWLLALEALFEEWSDPAPARNWAGRLEKAAGLLFATDPDDSAEWVSHIASLASVTCNENLCAGTIFDWLHHRTCAPERGGAFAGHIAFGRFRQLQHLPCRVLAMVGMHDANFPTRFGAPAWDLLRAAPKSWDRNPRSDDRQLFLDAILTPTDRLIITAPVLNPRTNKQEPFSSCVDELLRVASAMGASNLVTSHRLQPFAPEYFQEGQLHSFDGFQYEIAQQLAGGAASGTFPFAKNEQPNETPPPTQVIALAELIAFWKSPAKAFVKALGIALPGEITADSDLDQPPLTLDSLGKFKVEEAAFTDKLSQSSNPARTSARLAADRSLPPGDLGRNVWASAQSACAGLVDAVKQRLGGRLALQVKLNGGPVVTGEAELTNDGSALLFYRVGKFEKPKHFLEPWLTALLAAASDKPLPSLLFDESHPDGRMLNAPKNARDTLDLLVRYYLDGQTRPVCYAPATSDAIARAIEKNSTDTNAAIAAGLAEWEKTGWNSPPGEGHDEAARLAWRDRDPFADPKEWLKLADAISRPLKCWYE